MKRVLYIIPLILLSFSLLGQSNSNSTSTSVADTISPEGPKLVLVIRKKEAILDQKEMIQIDPNHIKMIEVFKSGEILDKYDSLAGVILIYPKWRYRRYYKKMFIK